MSKTMDQDYKNTYATTQTQIINAFEGVDTLQAMLLVEQAAEIERLKGIIEETQRWHGRSVDENSTLRAQVEELENRPTDWYTCQLIIERDALREKFQTMTRLRHEATDTVDELREDLRREKACREGAESNSKWAAQEVLKLRAELADWKLAYDVMLKDANERLAALKPVPDVETQFYFVDTYMGQRCSANPNDGANIKLTFTDGKLTGAEVVG